jgi:AspT/YidE/YbjL antiporter-like protein
MNWLTELPSSQPIAWAVLGLMLVSVAGLALAQVKIKGIGLGVTGVLFAGIIAGHFGMHIDETVLEFARDFGLILFVFTIGLQLGPGFFASFRKEGLKLNLLAAAIVFLGAGVTIGAACLLKINPFASLGLFSGATTNTPSLGATQQMLKTLGGRFAEQSGLPPLAYAAAYPGAVAGIISVILFLKFAFRNEIEIVQTEQKELPENRASEPQETNFMPIFIGIALGVLVGAIPIAIPHIPVPVRLGMAGGPLIVAIILSRIGQIGPLVWQMPASTNIAFREFGIALFLACVGLKAGGNFFETVFTNEGFHWLLAGLTITIIPLLFVALFARFFLKLNFTTISGLLAGSMTDPPALAFAHTISASDAPLVAYATVYPLSMLLRIFTAQILVVILCG